MKFSNGKISPEQMFVMIFTEFTGAGIMSAPVIADYMCGRDGIVAMTATIIAALLMSVVILNYSGGKAFENKKLFWFLATLKYFIRLVMGMVLVVVFVKNNLLQTGNVLLLILPLVVCMWYGMKLGFEGRARLSQITFWFIIVAIIVAAWKSIQGFNRYNISPLFITHTDKVLLCTLVLFLVFTPVEMLFWCKLRVQGGNVRTNSCILLAILMSGIVSIIFFVIAKGSNRHFIVKTDTVPVSALILIVVSVIQLIVTYGYYVRKCFEKCVGEKSSFFKSGTMVKNVYISLLAAIVTMIVCYVPVSQNVIKKMQGNINIIQSAYGNTDSNIEQRSYVMTMGVDYDESEGFKVWINEADNTGDVDEDGMGTNNNSSSNGCDIEMTGVKCFTDDNIELLTQRLKTISNNETDFSNVKTLVFGTGVIRNEKIMHILIEYFKGFNGFNNRCYVVVAEDSPEEVIASSAVRKEFRYEYISEMLSNNYKKYDVTLAEMLSGLDGSARKSIRCMVISGSDGEIRNVGSCVFNENGSCRILDDDTDLLLDCIDGRAENCVITTDDGEMYRIKYMDNNVNLDIINDETIGIHINIIGQVKKVNYTGEEVGNNNTANDEDNEEMCEWIKYKLESVLRSMLMDDSIDYMQFYNRLSVEDRVMWLKYRGRERELYKHTYFDVNCDITQNSV